MVKPHNAPVTIQVYLGSGGVAEKLRELLISTAQKEDRSLSEFILRMVGELKPSLLREAMKNGKK